jgi:uncharacterized protein (TIGR03083 family)
MKRKSIHEAVADERSELIADLGTLRPADWDAPSLCDGWLVRDVVGHLIRLERVYRYSLPFFIGTARYGMRVNTYIREDARRRAQDAHPSDLVDALSATCYEAAAFAKWHPMSAVPLSELVVHGQDIRRPLGLTREFDVERLMPVANLLRRRFGVLGRGRRLSGIRFDATDADWSGGSGEIVRAPMESIVMRLAGRRVA